MAETSLRLRDEGIYGLSYSANSIKLSQLMTSLRLKNASPFSSKFKLSRSRLSVTKSGATWVLSYLGRYDILFTILN